MVVFVHPLHLFHESWKSTANLVRENNILAFSDLFRNRTVRINGSKDGLICLLIKFSGEAPNHSSKSVTHSTNCLSGGTDWQLIYLIISINFCVVLL